MIPSRPVSHLGGSGGDSRVNENLRTAGLYPHVLVQSSDTDCKLRNLTKPFHDFGQPFHPALAVFCAIHAWFAERGAYLEHYNKHDFWRRSPADFRWLARVAELSSVSTGDPPAPMFFAMIHQPMRMLYEAPAVKYVDTMKRVHTGHVIGGYFYSYAFSCGVETDAVVELSYEQITEYIGSRRKMRFDDWHLPPGVGMSVEGDRLRFELTGATAALSEES
jgi:hypothetical protein